MSSLPEGWVATPIEHVTSRAAQRQPQPEEEFLYIDISSINRETKRVVSPQRLVGNKAPSRARQVVKTGDVLVSMTRPNMNAVALVSKELDGQIASTGFDVLRPVETESRWLFYLVRSSEFVVSMSDLVQGALYPAVRPRDIRGFEIPLAPIKEQKRIADKLDAVLARVDACRDRLDRLPLILKRFRQSILAAATSGKLTEDWREQNSIDGEWPQVKLGTVARDFTYGSAAKSSKSGLVPVLRMGNIQDGRLDWSDLVYTSVTQEIAKYRLAAGDVLFNRTNSPELVGKSAVFNGEHDAIYAGYLIRVRCASKLLPAYLNYCLGSPAGRDYCWQVKSDGVSQSNINAKKLAAFEFRLPSTEEQTEIVRRVETLFAYADRLAARHTTARAQVEKLTPAMLAKAFRGELVPQDPNDEPASELLARIQAARSEADIKPRRGRKATVKTTVRAPKEKKSAMTKSRQDDDVKGKPYLAAHLRKLGGTANVETLFKTSELPVTDFYKQLAWEVKQGAIRDGGEALELNDAA